MLLKDRRVLVTGATGFIGCRLAQRLAIEEGAIVTGAGRDLDKVSFLREAGVELRPVEMTDSVALEEALHGQEFVFHLAAASGKSDPEVAQQVNVNAVENLVRYAAEAGVNRFVHVSSMVVYGPPDQAHMTEDHPLLVDQSGLYGRTKAQGELQASRMAAELGLELAIIRPGMVFGPRGKSWSINLLKLVKRRVPVILGDGSGHAQPVYIDNLIDGLLLAATCPQVAGQAFNFVDRPLPWRDFFGYYGAMCGRKPRKFPLWLTRALIRFVGPAIGRSESPDDILSFYTNHSVYPISKAKRLLGYRPKITIEDGMRRTEAWFREAGYLPPVSGQEAPPS